MMCMGRWTFLEWFYCKLHFDDWEWEFIVVFAIIDLELHA